jgi:hypothetical protein
MSISILCSEVDHVLTLMSACKIFPAPLAAWSPITRRSTRHRAAARLVYSRFWGKYRVDRLTTCYGDRRTSSPSCRRERMAHRTDDRNPSDCTLPHRRVCRHRRAYLGGISLNKCGCSQGTVGHTFWCICHVHPCTPSRRSNTEARLHTVSGLSIREERTDTHSYARSPDALRSLLYT